MFDFACKNIRLLTAALALLLFLPMLPAGLSALPVAVEQVEGSHSLRPSAFYLVDELGDIGILEASSPFRQNQFARLEDGISVMRSGSLWLRFSLIKNNQALMRPLPEGAKLPLFLDLGPGMGGARLYVAESASTGGEIKAWRETMPTGSGHFILPDPDLLPLTVYVRLPGIPSLWFNPVLVRGDVDNGPISWTLILQISLGLVLAVMLIRGTTENEEWRFWAGAVLACAIIPTLFGQYGSEPNIIYLMAMPRLLAPGLAIMLMPHLGRYLLNSRGRKALDYTLIALSVPGVAAALAPLVPGLGWTARLLPLAPLLLLPLILISLSRLKSGQSGSALYLLFNLFPFAGALLALLPVLNPAFLPLESIGPNLTALGYLTGGLALALGKPCVAKEKGDFFPLNSFLEDGILPVALSAPGNKNAEACALDQLMDGPPLSLHQTDCPMQDNNGDKKNGLAELAEIFEPFADKGDKLVPGAEPEIIQLGLDMDVFAEDENTREEKSLPEGLPEELPGEVPEPEPAENAILPEQEEALKVAEEAAETVEEYIAEAAAQMKQDEKIIYIKDEEEPGLVILKSSGPEPIEGLAPAHHNPVHNWEYTAISRLEGALRAPYEELVHQLEDLQSRQEVTADYVENLGKSLEGLGLMLDNLERVARGEPLSAGPGKTIFNLAQLIRRIHEELLPLAEERGITLSWFVAPGLPAYFKGQEQEIAQAVKFLMQGTLDGASDGAVQLSVRQGVGPYAGQIQFSLQENGLKPGHLQRPSGWLNKAWELAAASGGSFNIDFIPDKGMAITLALPLEPLKEPAAPEVPAETPLSAALAEFAPGPEPEGSEEPIHGLPSIEEEDDDDVILLTDAIITPVPGTEPESNQESAPGQAEPEENAASGSGAAKPDEAEETPEPKLIIFSDDEIMDVPAVLTTDVSAPRPVAVKPREDKAARPEPAKGPREFIIIADMAASGRRLLARRLDGLPHKLIEARNAEEIVAAVAKNPVGLVIIDADMPEADVKRALEKIADYTLSHALSPIPSLCILSHESQAERMARLGCSETQIKSASRVQFRQTALRLCPHPKADPAELLPESPLLREAARQAVEDGKEGSAEAPVAPLAPVRGKKAQKGARVPMFDLIVASLDEEGETDEKGKNERKDGAPAAKAEALTSALREPYPLSSTDEEYMEAEMVPLIPGLLIVLEDSLEELESARQKNDLEQAREVAGRMAGQGKTFGLSTLERMARCVEKAAGAGDAEATRDFAEELASVGRRYLASLKETHEDYLKKN